MVALAIYTVALLAAYFLLDRYARCDSQSLSAESRKIAVEINQSNRFIQSLNHELSTARKKLQTVQQIGPQPDWGKMLALLSKKTSDQIVLNNCSLDRPSGGDDHPSAGDDTPLVLQLGGFAKVQSDVSTYVLSLEKLGLFEKVKLVKTSRETYLGQEAVSFRIECVLQAGGGTST